jgi:hypothetical protein
MNAAGGAIGIRMKKEPLLNGSPGPSTDGWHFTPLLPWSCTTVPFVYNIYFIFWKLKTGFSA